MGKVGVEVLGIRDPPAERDSRCGGERIMVLGSALGGGSRLVEVGTRGYVSPRHIAEVSAYPRHRLVGVEVTGERQDCVAGCVVLVEEVAGVLHRRALQVLEAAVPVVGVGE